MNTNNLGNSEIPKPEWFVMADADTNTQKNPSGRKFRIMALTIPLQLLNQSPRTRMTIRKWMSINSLQ